MSQPYGDDPAFPAPSVFGDENVGHQTLEVGDLGMTIRDFFAAHAPTCPEKWADHTPAPGKPERAAEPLRKDLPGAGSYERALTEWSDAYKPYLEALAAWRVRDEIARLAQWPWAYADLVLAARDPQPATEGPTDDAT